MRCPYCGAEQPDDADVCFGCRQALPTFIGKGKVIANRYEIHGLLGKGGMGAVYRAFDQVLEEEIAIKILRTDRGQVEELAKRFRSEIKLARKVRHRNVCGIHDYGEDGTLRYISMELVEGVDLKELLEQRVRFTPEEALDASLQICQGLEAIHAASIVHRDLKPQNLMMQSDGVIRLMDFGIAKRVGSDTTGHTRTGQIIGTPEYMSPEQARGEKVDFRSDIYAAGIVMFELFTGSVPFKGETPVATIMKHIQEPPPLDGEAARRLPAELVTILGKVLAKDVDDRPESISKLLLQLKITPVRAAGRVKQTPAADSDVWEKPTQSQPSPVATPMKPTPAPAPLPRRDSTSVASKVVPPPQRVEPRAMPTPPRPATGRTTSPSLAGQTNPAMWHPGKGRGLIVAATSLTLMALVVAIALVGYSIYSARSPVEVATQPASPDEPATQPEAGVDTATQPAPTPEPAAMPNAPPVEGSRSRRQATRPPARQQARPKAIAPAGSPTPSTARPAPTATDRKPARPPDEPAAGEPSATPIGDWISPDRRPGPGEGADPGSGRAAATETPSGAPPGETRSQSSGAIVPAPPGVLRFGVKPWAKISVDGVVIGTSPMQPLELAPGVHTVLFEHPAYRPIQRKVTIVSRETERVRVDFGVVGIPK